METCSTLGLIGVRCSWSSVGARIPKPPNNRCWEGIHLPAQGAWIQAPASPGKDAE